MKHGRLAHIRSQFSLFRRSPTHKNLPLATFCTSEQLLFGSFCRSKKNVKSSPLQGVSRFCKPRISSPQGGFAQPLRGISRRQSRQLGIFYNDVIKYSQALNSHQRQDGSQCPVTREPALKKPDIPPPQNRPSPAEMSLKTSGSPCAQD